MGLLDRAIKRGLDRAVKNTVATTVERKITEAAAPKINEAINKAADTIIPTQQTTYTQGNSTVYTSGSGYDPSANASAAALGNAFGGMMGAMTSFANEAAKNMKICSACGEAAKADVKFCPSCGAKLPEMTVAQGAVCTSCGKENTVGTKFCAGCGAKLPAAIAEENAAQEKIAAVMAQWDTLLPQYPKWNFGGVDMSIESDGDGANAYYTFFVNFGRGRSGEAAVSSYRQLLMQSGFRQAGQYPDLCHLYRMSGGVCYHVDTEHCFDGGSDCATIYFNISEPTGGYNYVKPQPKQKSSIFDLFK